MLSQDQFRLNGGRIYQQARRLRRGEREYQYHYWYCRSGWGRVSHLGGTLPPAIEEALTTQRNAAEALKAIDRVAGLLRRLVAGDALSEGERAALAEMGYPIPDEVHALTQRKRPELHERSVAEWDRTREIAAEVLSQEERDLLERVGLGKFVRRPGASEAQNNGPTCQNT